MKKGAKIAIAISGTLVIALAVGGTIFYVNKNKYNPEKVLEEYTSLINDKKYEEMYSKTTKGSQGNISKEDFIKRNKNIYEGIEATNIKNKVKEVKKDGECYNITYETFGYDYGFVDSVRDGRVGGLRSAAGARRGADGRGNRGHLLGGDERRVADSQPRGAP